MKNHTIFLILFLLLVFFTGANLLAEIEPNNTYQQASVIGPNSTGNGSLNEATQSAAADNDDYWQITIPSDGTLYIETNATSNLDIDLYIFDINGTTSIASAYRTGLKEWVSHRSLKAGTYYVRVYRGGGTGSYTILTKFDAAPYANDAEPNDNYQTAQALGLNTQSTGHIRHYSNGSTDYDDWWKVTIPYDGSLTIKTVSDSADIDLYIFDINGTTSIVSAYKTGLTEEIEHTHLMPGTYYIKVYGAGAHGGYTITSTYTQVAFNGITTNDVEINDGYTTAINFVSFNGTDSTTSYGHLGYFTNNHTDHDDWWAITANTDGKLVVKTESNSTLDIDLYLFDVNGTSSIRSAYITGINEQITFSNLATGKYYLRAYGASGYGSYKITAVFTIPTMPNDPEPNDDAATARSITAGSTLTGHLGYFSNNYTDRNDNYVFNVPAGWDSLYVRTDSDPSLDIDIYLSNSSHSGIASAYTTGSKEILKYKGPVAGQNYYIRAYGAIGQGSYGIKVTNHYPGEPVTDVQEKEQEELPTAFYLAQNYPNPFNPETTIRYDIPQTSNVTLKVYDILGKEIATLINREHQAGSYTIIFNAGILSSGVYFYRISAGKFTQTKKFMVMK